ncbi:MAG: styrene monooxygenase/indole monooxygenase family protein [Alphaproteobacteria bacterium]
MRKIAIIGSGQTGLLAGIGLRDKGYDVTLYSDRTARDWLENSVPTGIAGIQIRTTELERSLGLAFWEEEAVRTAGVDFTFSLDGRNIFFRLQGRYKGPLYAIDLRLKSARWMEEFEKRGGRLIIQSVDEAALDAIADQNDLTLVAAGKAEMMGRIFERDAARSVYERPQRNLAMLLVKDVKPFRQGIPFEAMKFNFFAPFGEYFWVPFYHMNGTNCMSVLFEAKEGGPMDRWMGRCEDGHQAVEIAKDFIREHAPWEFDNVRDMTLMDDKGWLVGKFPPTVRKPVGRLSSGRIVAPLGDTCMAFDPIGGMGANNASNSAKIMMEEIVAHGDRPFDAGWMTRTFERHWTEFGQHAWTFNNLLLEPLDAPAREVLVATSQSRQLADDFFSHFNEPREFFPMLTELGAARDYISETTGRHWLVSAIRGWTRILLHQLRQKLAGRPLTPKPAR